MLVKLKKPPNGHRIWRIYRKSWPGASPTDKEETTGKKVFEKKDAKEMPAIYSADTLGDKSKR